MQQIEVIYNRKMHLLNFNEKGCTDKNAIFITNNYNFCYKNKFGVKSYSFPVL